MTSTFEAELELSAIHKHPLNPRRRAVADQELTDSVKANGLIEPLIVIPERDAGDYVTGYLLIAGHRRLDACKKAKRTTAPAIVREDLTTPQLQLEAMLVENDNREDLSPIEQATGYQQLQLEFGYTQKAIAAAVGKDTKTVRSRLQLLKLGKPTQKKLHDGQLTIDDGLALVEFADDPATTKRLTQAISSPYGGFKHELQSARRRRGETIAADKQIGKYERSGVPEYKLSGDEGLYSLKGATRTAAIGVDEDLHTDCLAYVASPANSYQGKQIATVCTDPARHDDQLDETRKKRADEEAQRRAEHDAREAVEDDSRAVRISTMRESPGPILPPQLKFIVKATLPALLIHLQDEPLLTYFEVLDVDEADRWQNRWYESHKKRNLPALERHLATIDSWSDEEATKALTTVLAAVADNELTGSDWSRVDVAARRYVEVLEALDHPFTDIDREYAAAIAGEQEPTEAAS